MLVPLLHESIKSTIREVSFSTFRPPPPLPPGSAQFIRHHFQLRMNHCCETISISRFYWQYNLITGNKPRAESSRTGPGPVHPFDNNINEVISSILITLPFCSWQFSDKVGCTWIELNVNAFVTEAWALQLVYYLPLNRLEHIAASSSINEALWMNESRMQNSLDK